MLACFAGLSTIIVIIQERRSENALEALRALGAPKASAIRGGVEIKIPARDLVPGDIIRVSEGERVAADAIIWRAQELTLDESLLTGEGAPVHKSPLKSDFAGKSPAPGDSAETFLFAGTLVVRGHGLAEVHATGLSTAAGHIGASLATIEIEPTLLQRTIARLVRIFGAVALLVSISLVLFYGLTRGDCLQAVLSGIALAMGMLPEEFPMVLVIFLALGAWRLAQIKVLARRPAVIETLGAATVLCVDKTGTLTENRMRTRALDNGSEQFECLDDGSPLPEPFHTLVEFALLASRTGGYDPMDSAVERTVRDHLTGTEHVHLNWRLGREYGISEELLAMSQVWLDETGTHVIATKGAPEAIADLCHFAPSARQALLLRVQVLAERGLRVLGWREATPLVRSRTTRMISISAFLGLWRSKIRCDRRFRLRWRKRNARV